MLSLNRWCIILSLSISIAHDDVENFISWLICAFPHNYRRFFLLHNATYFNASSIFVPIFNGLFFKRIFPDAASDLSVRWQLLFRIAMIYTQQEMFSPFICFFFSSFFHGNELKRKWIKWIRVEHHRVFEHHFNTSTDSRKLTQLTYRKSCAIFYLYLSIFPWKNDLCAGFSLSKKIWYKRYQNP